MQKIFCFLITCMPLFLMAQDKIDFYSAAKAKNNCCIPSAIYKTITGADTENHTLEIVLSVPVGQQQSFHHITGILRTQQGELPFSFPEHIIADYTNTLVFTSRNGKVYVYFNEELIDILEDVEHAFSISNPGYQCALTNNESSTAIMFRAESITAGYKLYNPSARLPFIAKAGDIKSADIFPNPVHNILNISCGINGPATINVLNAAGQAQFAKDISGKTAAIDIGALPAGLYFIHISAVGNAGIIKSFIKQ